MPIPASDLSYIFDLIYRRSGIVLDAEKEYLVESRLRPIARTEGLASTEAFLALLRQQPEGRLHKAAVEALTTNETSFFRDEFPFEALRQEILPALKVSRAAARSLVILSAACSTGQEAYSILMVLREHFPELESWSVRIIGVDLAEAVLERARDGLYRQSEVDRGLSLPLLNRYFDRVSGDYRIKEPLRKAVEFRQMNLTGSWSQLPRVDVMFLRNVLIYFDLPTKKAILARARQAMAADGYLFLGGAETTLNIDEAYDRVQLGKATAYRPGRPAKG